MLLVRLVYLPTFCSCSDLAYSWHARPDRLRQGYGGPPKLHAKAEGGAYWSSARCPGRVWWWMAIPCEATAHRPFEGRAPLRFSISPHRVAADRVPSDRRRAARSPPMISASSPEA